MPRQDSLTDQMLDLAVIARRLGMYDAEDYIRKAFAPEPAVRQVAVAHESTPQGARSLGYCGVPGRNGVCIKPPKHGQRHRYGIPPVAPHVKPERSWESISAYQPEGSRFTLLTGAPCKVKGVGRGGGVSTGWTIVSMERHRETGKVNIEVKQGRNGHTRTFPADKILYARPKKVTS